MIEVDGIVRWHSLIEMPSADIITNPRIDTTYRRPLLSFVPVLDVYCDCDWGQSLAVGVVYRGTCAAGTRGVSWAEVRASDGPYAQLAERDLHVDMGIY